MNILPISEIDPPAITVMKAMVNAYETELNFMNDLPYSTWVEVERKRVELKIISLKKSMEMLGYTFEE